MVKELVGLNNLLQDEHLAFQGSRYMKEVIPVGIVRDQIRDSQKGCRLQADKLVADDKVNQNNHFCSEDDEYEEQLPPP